MRTIQDLFHRDTNALSEQTLISAFTRAEVEEEPSLQTPPQPTAATTLFLQQEISSKGKTNKEKTKNKLAYIYIHTK